MRGEPRALKGAAEIAIAECGEAVGIEHERPVAFLEREEPAGVPNDVGVGDAAILADDGRIAGRRIAPAAEPRLMRSMLGFPFRRAYPAIAIRDAAVGDVKGVDHAVADEPMMIRIARR